MTSWQEQLNKLKRLQPTPQMVEKQRGVVLAQIENEGRNDAVEVSSWRYVLSHPFLVKPLAYVAAVVLLLVGGSYYTMSAAVNSEPGNAFYPVKVQFEKWQTALISSSDADKVQKQIEFVDRRLAELSKVSQEETQPFDKQTKVAVVAKHLNSSLREVKDTLEKAAQDSPEEEVVKVAKLVKDKSVDVQQSLSQSDLPAEVRTVLIKEVEDVQLSALQVLIDRYKKERDQLIKADIEKQLQDKVAELSGKVSLLPEDQQTDLFAKLQSADSYIQEENFAQALAEIKAVNNALLNQSKEDQVLGVEELTVDGQNGSSTATSTK